MPYDVKQGSVALATITTSSAKNKCDSGEVEEATEQWKGNLPALASLWNVRDNISEQSMNK